MDLVSRVVNVSSPRGLARVNVSSRGGGGWILCREELMFLLTGVSRGLMFLLSGSREG